MSLTDIFKRLGYPKHSGRVYEILVASKESLLVATIAQRAKISRVVVYRILERMKADGLISAEKSGKRVRYAIHNPRALERLVQGRERVDVETIEAFVGETEKHVPKSVRFLHGPSGIRAVFNDVVDHTPKGDTFYRYTSERNLAEVNQYLSRDYRVRRDKKKLERLVISNPVSGKQKRGRLERFIKYVPQEVDQFTQNIIQLVYGKRIAIIDLSTKTAMIVENEQLADFQKVVFRLLYKRL
jgi:sugar-specific transcriptional regulator TrmB